MRKCILHNSPIIEVCQKDFHVTEVCEKCEKVESAVIYSRLEEASSVAGPQTVQDESMVKRLEQNMQHFKELFETCEDNLKKVNKYIFLLPDSTK